MSFCVPLKTKSAAEVLQAYIDNVYTKFGGSLKILSDNGTEFKNKLCEDIAKQLGVKHKKYTPPYMPSSNGHIEGFHNFLKACISKHICVQLEWTNALPLTCAAYNFVPNEHSHESPFFIMFGRNPVLPLNSLLSPRLWYLGNDLNLLSLEALQNMFHIVTENLRKALSRWDSPMHPLLLVSLQNGACVLIKNHTAAPFDPKYVGNFRVVKVIGNQVELVSSMEVKSKREHMKNVKYIKPAEWVIVAIPDYSTCGGATKLRLNPLNIPDLGLEVDRWSKGYWQGK